MKLHIPCLKEGCVRERGNKQYPLFFLLFLCSRREQSSAPACSSFRARRNGSHSEPKKCPSFESIWLVLWWLNLAHIEHVQLLGFFFSLLFVLRGCSPAAAGFCTALSMLQWDGHFYPNPADLGKRRWSERLYRQRSSSIHLRCAVLLSPCWEDTEHPPAVGSLWRSLLQGVIQCRAKLANREKCGKKGQPTFCLACYESIKCSL